MGQAERPLLCSPFTTAAALCPVSSGSSEKYSKLRPHSGLRWMFMVFRKYSIDSCVARNFTSESGSEKDSLAISSSVS